MPSADSGPGGGYFISWRGKGLAIDPGFDFLSNFIYAGHALGEISGLVVSHSHVDHARDLEALFTGKHVRRRSGGQRGQPSGEELPLDVFASLDTFLKYGPLITSQSELVVNRDTLMVLTPGCSVRLPKEPNDYGVDVQVLRADHLKPGDSPWVQHGVGLILTFLDEDKGESVGSIGFAGDSRMTAGYARCFAECDIVVGHLGTVELAQLLAMAAPGVTAQLREVLDRWEQSGDSMFKEGEKELFESLIIKDWTGGAPPSAQALRDRLERLLNGDEQLIDSSAYSGHSLFEGVRILFEETLRKGSATLGVVSEFGLELGAFRHEVAEVLDAGLGDGKRTKTVVTGDLGLVINLWKRPQECGRLTSDHGSCDGCPADTTTSSRVTVFCGGCGQHVPAACVTATCIRFRRKAMQYRCPNCRQWMFSPPAPLIS